MSANEAGRWSMTAVSQFTEMKWGQRTLCDITTNFLKAVAHGSSISIFQLSIIHVVTQQQEIYLPVFLKL